MRQKEALRFDGAQETDAGTYVYLCQEHASDAQILALLDVPNDGLTRDYCEGGLACCVQGCTHDHADWVGWLKAVGG